MKKIFYIIFISLIFISYFAGCAFSRQKTPDTTSALASPLKTEQADISEISGTFKLILYGGRYSDDIETVAILDYEGDRYDLEPFAPDFDYRIKKGIPDREAIEEAKKFISFHHAFHKFNLSRIVDSKGDTIGFEFRPLYYPFVYGFIDLMEIHYWLKEEGKVKVTIRLSPAAEKLRYPGGGDGGDGGD
ncbi:MAG: hypothetical protein IBX72_05115 [Nitrospirae bacterium]|nr:hypothetical protein [Nitrospirota bacterium]